MSKTAKFGPSLRLAFSAALMLGLLSLQSCVYFNTYYNAKRYFREGVKENENNETGRPKTTNYQKAIDSAARVLEYYPESKYVDDALMIMGKAYYEIRTYPKAKRKFEELLANYPNSDLRDEAQLWLGKTLIAMGQADQGIEILTKLWSEGKSEQARLESQRRLADYHFEKENYRQALLEYEKILQNSKDKKQRADVWYQAGECHYALGEYEQAEKAYLEVLDEKPVRKRQFEATFKRSETLRMRGQLEPALAICEDLLKKEAYFNYSDQVYLAKAVLLTELGRLQEAEELFKRIIELYPRTDASAKASYLLGKIYLEQLKDFQKAEEYLTKVQTEKAGSEFFQEAQSLVNDLRFLKTLNTQIDSLQADIDTLNYRLNWLSEHPGESFPEASPLSPEGIRADTLQGTGMSALYDSLRFPQRPEAIAQRQHELRPGYVPERPGMEGEMPPQGPGAVPAPQPQRRRLQPLPADSAGIIDRISNDQQELAELRFRLAEHLWMQFGNADTASVILTNLAQLQEYPDVAARSVLSIYNLQKKASPDSSALDSLLKLVHEKFPGTIYDRWVRPSLGLEPLPEPVDSAAQLFREAEDLWLENNQPASAVREYQKVWRLYPQTDWGSKALFAAAWLQEHVLNDVSGALASYDSLIARYPDSPYFVIAQKKVAPPPPEIPDTTRAAVDTTKAPAEVAVAGPAPTTGTGPPQLVGGDAALEDYIHKNHLYPQVAMEANLSGEALVSFTVDVQGNPRDFSVLREDPEGFDFGAMAIQALQAMKFRPGYAGGQFVESPMNQLVRFNP